MKQILLTLVFSVVNTWSAWALDFGFRHLNTSNGLPNQQVGSHRARCRWIYLDWYPKWVGQV